MENQKGKILGPWAYVGLRILYAIPVIGFIFLLIFTFNSKNTNRANFTRSFWCELLLGIIIIALLFAVLKFTDGFEEFRIGLAEYLRQNVPNGEAYAEIIYPSANHATEDVTMDEPVPSAVPYEDDTVEIIAVANGITDSDAVKVTEPDQKAR